MSKKITLDVKNKCGSTLQSGKLVYLSGFDIIDLIITVDKADATDNDKMPVIGVVEDTIYNNNIGKIIVSGLSNNFDTSNYSINWPVFVGEDGDFISLEDPDDLPSSYIVQQIGLISRSANNPDGQIVLLPLLANTSPLRLHSSSHSKDERDEISHNNLKDLLTDTHKIYTLVNGARGFTSAIHGIDPTLNTHLSTKNYVDTKVSKVAPTVTPSGTTQTLNFSKGIYQVLSLASASGDVTVSFSNLNSGATHTVEIRQAAGAPFRNIVWPLNIKWSGGSTPTITAASDAVDLVEFKYNGINCLANIRQDMK